MGNTQVMFRVMPTEINLECDCLTNPDGTYRLPDELPDYVEHIHVYVNTPSIDVELLRRLVDICIAKWYGLTLWYWGDSKYYWSDNNWSPIYIRRGWESNEDEEWLGE